VHGPTDAQHGRTAGDSSHVADGTHR
jgi:hypothetical protein